MPTIADLKETSAYKNYKSKRGQPKSKMKKKDLEKLVNDYYKNLTRIPQYKKNQADVPEKLKLKDLKNTQQFLNFPNIDKKSFTKEQILTFVFGKNQDFLEYFKVKNLQFQENRLYSEELNSEKKERIKKYNFCKKKVDDILKKKDQWKVCISGPSRLEKKLKYVGKGSFGVVNKFTEDNCEIVVKEIGLKNQDFIRVTKKHFLTEFNLLKSFSEDINFCFFTPLLYGIGFCNSCTDKICSVFFMEVFDSSAKKLLMSESLSVSCVFMILDALWYLQKNYGFIHYDIKLANILVKKDFSKRDSPLFTQFPGIRNPGYIFYLSDYGVSSLSRPNKVFEKKDGYFDYGLRLISINNQNQASPLHYSKTSQHGKNTIDLVPTRIIQWKDTNLVGTRNFVNSKFSLKKMGGPEIDLNDMTKYPDARFLGDICDVFKMFIGGKRSTQKGYHNSSTMSENIREIFENWNIFNLGRFINYQPSIEDVYLFRADLAQRYFYNLLSKISFFRKTNVEKPQFTLGSEIYVMTVSDLFLGVKVPAVPTKLGTKMVLKIADNGHLFFPENEFGEIPPIQILNFRDEMGLEGTYHGGEFKWNGPSQLKDLVVYVSDYIEDEVENLLPQNVRIGLGDYNNLPLLFYLKTLPSKISDLSFLNITEYKPSKVVTWDVFLKNTMIGKAVAQPSLFDMMGDQAGVLLLGTNKKIRAFGNFEISVDNEFHFLYENYYNSSVFEPNNNPLNLAKVVKL